MRRVFQFHDRIAESESLIAKLKGCTIGYWCNVHFSDSKSSGLDSKSNLADKEGNFLSRIADMGHLSNVEIVILNSKRITKMFSFFYSADTAIVLAI